MILASVSNTGPAAVAPKWRPYPGSSIITMIEICGFDAGKNPTKLAAYLRVARRAVGAVLLHLVGGARLGGDVEARDLELLARALLDHVLERLRDHVGRSDRHDAVRLGIFGEECRPVASTTSRTMRGATYRPSFTIV